jgi:hypothetical protein
MLREFLRLPAEPRAASSWFLQTFSAETQARTVTALLDGLLPSERNAGART